MWCAEAASGGYGQYPTCLPAASGLNLPGFQISPTLDPLQLLFGIKLASFPESFSPDKVSTLSPLLAKQILCR